MTTSFYAPPEAFVDGRVALPDEEAAHAARVLRARAGDEVVVVDGVGGWHRVVLDHVDKRRVVGHVVERREDVGEPGYELTVALGLLKNRNRYETFLEKAVELGVRRVVPLVTARTEKSGMRRGRAEGILVAGMKQSGRSRLVELAEPTALADVLGGDGYDLRVVCHEAAAREAALVARLEAAEARRLLVLVGPEGGFTDDEVAAAEAAGAVVASLGPRRLRAETAAMAAAAAVMLHAR